MKDYLTLAEAAEYLGKSKETLRRWDNDGKLLAVREPLSNYRVYKKIDLDNLFSGLIDVEVPEKITNFVIPEREYKVIELFAGAGGLAVGLEKAGLKCEVLNDFVKNLN